MTCEIGLPWQACIHTPIHITLAQAIWQQNYKLELFIHKLTTVNKKKKRSCFVHVIINTQTSVSIISVRQHVCRYRCKFSQIMSAIKSRKFDQFLNMEFNLYYTHALLGSILRSNLTRATSHTSQEPWPWNCESLKESVQSLSQDTSKIM